MKDSSSSGSNAMSSGGGSVQTTGIKLEHVPLGRSQLSLSWLVQCHYSILIHQGLEVCNWERAREGSWNQLVKSLGSLWSLVSHWSLITVVTRHCGHWSLSRF